MKINADKLAALIQLADDETGGGSCCVETGFVIGTTKKGNIIYLSVLEFGYAEEEEKTDNNKECITDL